MIQSLGLSSELLVMEGLSTFRDYGAYAVQITESEPDYWSGNQLILRKRNVGAEFAIGEFQMHFPNARHVAFVWDIPGLVPGDIDPAFLAAGCELDLSDVLTLEGQIAEVPTPAGIVLREVSSRGDWEQSLALQREIGIEDGFDDARHRHFLQRRNISRRVQIERGLGAWFGAFDGDLLVAQMGMFHDERVARYQSVETRASHRRRGICAALLLHARLWALERAPEATPVIIAESESAAGRLYRRMGFAHVETLVGLLRRGY